MALDSGFGLCYPQITNFKECMVTLADVSKHVGGRLLFDQANLNLHFGQRYGVVGANGTGKSTLLRMIAGEEETSLGDIHVAKGKTLGWLKQDQHLFDETPILHVVLQGKEELWRILQKKEKLLNHEAWTDEMAYKLAELEEKFGMLGGYEANALAEKFLGGLGVEGDYEAPLKTLSGGYKLRVLLARALFDQPDILLLDEPTNYLDIVSIGWLENYLKYDFQGLVLFVSHDRNFLENLATRILDIDYGEIRDYSLNYVKFLVHKELVIEQKKHELKQLEGKIAQMQRFVDRFKAKPSKARQAMSKQKMIDKIELPDVENTSRIKPSIDFRQARPSGQVVLKAAHLSKSYGKKDLFQGVDLRIERGEKIAIVGPNGIGKSTLVKILMELISPTEGSVEWGYNTQVCYFAQEHREQLGENATVFNWLSNACENISDEKVRSVLGALLFKQDDVYKNTLSLSGGEMARLLMAVMMLKNPNVLVMDEPTNHLDLESIDALTEALVKYPGTVILVSHDRYFISHFASRIIAITHEGVNDHHGTYDEFIQRYGVDYLRT